MQLIPDDLLDYRVSQAIEIGGGRDLKFFRGDDDTAPTFRELTDPEVHCAYVLPEGCFNLIGEDADLERMYTVAWIDRRWWYLGDWQLVGHQEARRCGFTTIGPEPRYGPGQKPWIAVTIEGKRGVKCPDCEDGFWEAKAPKSGTTAKVRCPRCDGRGELTERAIVAEVRQVEIGAVKTNSGAKPGLKVDYSSGKDGYGHQYHDWELFDNEAEAEALAEILADLRNEELERMDANRALNRDLWIHSYDQAEIKKAKREASSAQHDLDDLRRRAFELLDEGFPYVSGDVTTFEEWEQSESTFEEIPEATRQRIVFWLFSGYDPDGKAADWLHTALREKRQEDCSC